MPTWVVIAPRATRAWRSPLAARPAESVPPPEGLPWETPHIVRQLKVLLFDVFGTLVDWRGSLIAAAEDAGARSRVDAAWPDVVDDWRRAYQPALDRARSDGEWRNLDSLQRQTLADVLAGHGVELSREECERLVAAWHRLHPWPDTAEGLELLRRDYVTATLSNGHVALLVDLLRFGDLRVDAILSAELASSYKPDPSVYLTALRLLATQPEEAGMVAAHPTDLRAAAALGLRPFFVSRPLEWGPQGAPAEPPPLRGLVTADSLVELAAQLHAR